MTPLRAADLPGAGPDADPAAMNDFLDVVRAARPRDEPDSGGPAVSLLELADVAQSHGSGTNPEDTPPKKEPEPKSAEPARNPWTILWRKHVTNLTSASRPATMRHKLTASALTSLARWTPYLESEMCGLRTVVRPGSVCIDVGSAADLYTTGWSRAGRT
jgi:hypothetical protein